MAPPNTCPSAADREQALALFGEGVCQSATARSIGLTPAPGRFPHCPLKGVPFLLRVNFGRRAVFHDAAQVKEPFLRPGRFPPAIAPPLDDKILRRHSWLLCSR